MRGSTVLTQLLPATIPSPEQGVWFLGPVPIRAYALCIVLGVVVCLWLSERRWQQRGGRAGLVYDVAVWAIPFGLVGARLYHVLSTPEAYFGADGSLVNVLYVWRGGLGIWGAVLLGAVGAWIGTRRAGVRLPVFADAVAPGIVLAQAIGRWGNWFNQELFGRPTDQPWGLEIDPLMRPVGFEQFSTFHPTFLYEFFWNIGVAVLVITVDRWLRLGHGRAFALYVALYTLGRGWIEMLRIDDAEVIGPLRLNVWTSIIVFALAVAYLVVVGRLRPGRETSVSLPGREPVAESGSVKTVGAGASEHPAAKTGKAADGTAEKTGDETADQTADEESATGETAAAEPSAGATPADRKVER